MKIHRLVFALVIGAFFPSTLRAHQQFEGFISSGPIAKVDLNSWPNVFYALKSSIRNANELIAADNRYWTKSKKGTLVNASSLLSSQARLANAKMKVNLKMRSETPAQLLAEKNREGSVVTEDAINVPIFNIRTNEVWPEVTCENALQLCEQAGVLDQRIATILRNR